jgi:two-component system, sensor histidine kinase
VGGQIKVRCERPGKQHDVSVARERTVGVTQLRNRACAHARARIAYELARGMLASNQTMSSESDTAVPVEVEEVDTRPILTASRILVVDDTPANLIAAEAALSPLSRAIVLASSGREALAHLLDHEFALALLDVHMPDMDGYELAKLIRARERTQHLPIIFMTAHAHNETSVLRAYELGAVDFLFRPVLPEVLRAKTSVFVALQERNEQLAAERMERDFENRRRDYETAALRRERDREQEANKELNRLNEALAEHDRRKDSFIAILAHELRNPLASLRTCVDLLHGAPGQPPTPRVVGALDRQTNVLMRLVDDLLDVSRIKADKIELRPEPLDLVEAVESAIATCRPFIDDKRHTISLETPSGRVSVVGDSIRIGQVIGNLLSNAARYTPAGGRIEVEVAATDTTGIVRIKDSGIGIPTELQDSIFNMFVQERVRSDGSGGLGLGLALSRRLIEMHNGAIKVESEGRGKGTTFEFQLPRSGTPIAIALRKRTRDMQPLKAEPSQPAAIRTIVIDDNEDARDLLCDLLRTRGYEVLSAADGNAGLDLIREHRPDVALVDLGLPKLDGFAVIEALQRDCPDLKTRLVALTGYGETADYERTKRAGFHAHLVKPASAVTIFECLAQQLAHQTDIVPVR